MIHDLLSQRSENHLVKIMVSSVDHSAEAGSTQKKGLNSAETSACLGGMERAPFLCLVVYTDLMVKQSDLTELHGLLVKWCQSQTWYDSDLQHMSRRVEGMAANAILDLNPNPKKHLTARQKAINLGIGSTAYHKKWHFHQQDVSRQTHLWLVDAAQRLHFNSGTGNPFSAETAKAERYARENNK